MKWAFLKTIRVVVSLLFLGGIAYTFLYLGQSLSEAYADGVLYLQFLPSLLMFLGNLTITASGFIIILVLTALFGRIYCSSLCPLGTLQDIITWVIKKLTPRKRRLHFFKYTQPKNALRFSILGLSVLLFLLGSITLFNLLDPYSNFGRLMTHFVRPVVIAGNNFLVSLLEHFDKYWLLPVEQRPITLPSLIFPIVFLSLLLWLAIKHGRLYCNTVCPVGALLGLISRGSLLQLKINSDLCNNCSECVWSCKANCINRKQKTIDYSRCVSCFNCLKACEQNAIEFKNNWIVNKKASPALIGSTDVNDLSKRSFLISLVAIASASSGFIPLKDTVTSTIKKVVPKKASTVPIEREYPVAPPGAENFAHFMNYCTGCSLCVSACPNHVLQPSIFQYGLEGFLQPHMDYNSGFCNYDCQICADVCPTGALSKFVDLEAKQTTQLGKAKFIKENCVVHTESTDCGACSEHCPTKAVEMVPYEDTGLFIPEVNDEICVGCGACEFPCPVHPYKAIYVDGNVEHQKVEKPKEEELELDQKPAEDFPF